MAYEFLNIDSTPAHQLEAECQRLEHRIKKVREEIDRRQKPEKEAWAVPVFVYMTPGSGRTMYHVFDTSLEAYDNAYRIRVTENPVYDESEMHEQDFESRMRVLKVYR